jgi:hypothetical protein
MMINQNNKNLTITEFSLGKSSVAQSHKKFPAFHKLKVYYYHDTTYIVHAKSTDASE